MVEELEISLSDLVTEPEKKKYLLAVSGGIDSAVMAFLFREAGLNYGIAHCNFQLRGKESDSDLKFVKKLASIQPPLGGNGGAPFYSVSFNTMEYVKKNKVSVQMAARELRYKWFNEICAEKGYDYIVTAHNKDDSIETFFINLIRGSGISGLKGMKAMNGNIIRPLLRFWREEIEMYAKNNNVKWREDSSNAGFDYSRNRIRHFVLPALDKVDEFARRTIYHSIELLASTEEVYKDAVKKLMKRFIKKTKDNIEIDLDLFNKLSPGHIYLYEAIKEFGFNYEQCLLIEDCVKRKVHSGKRFYSFSHRLMIDREHLSILSKKSGEEEYPIITPDISGYNLDFCFCLFKILKKDEKFIIEPSLRNAGLDYDKLEFPLEIRKWKNGDRFYPLGMKQSKKVSDFLIDNKISISEKEKVLVLSSNGKIAWVIGYRIDDRFKITDATKKVYLCTLTNEKVNE